MTWASAGRIKNLKVLEYVPDTLSTRYRCASKVQRAFHTRLGYATEATSNKIGTHMERTPACFKRAVQTRSERIQRTCSARGTYSRRISHTPGTRRAFRKFLSMFNIFGAQTRAKRAETLSDVRRRAPDVHQAYPTRL